MPPDPRPLVLVIEDNADNLTLMRFLLDRLGYEPVLAQTGAAGVVSAREHRPALVLCDLQMPELDGFETLARLRAEGVVNGTPVIALTALAMSGDRERILSAGFDGYLSKPIDPARLNAQLAVFLGEE